MTSSCLTLGRVMRDVIDGDVIKVDDWPCREKRPINVVVSLTIVGSSTKSCLEQTNNHTRQVSLNATGSDSSSIVHLRLERLTIVNTLFEVYNSHVTLVECTVMESTLREGTPLTGEPDEDDEDSFVGLHLINTTWKTVSWKELIGLRHQVSHRGLPTAVTHYNRSHSLRV